MDQDKRFCIYLDETMHSPNGYVPSAVYENESGHRPLLGSGELSQPTYLGHDFEVAKQAVAEWNEKLGLSEIDVQNIMVSSMRASFAEDAANERYRNIMGRD